MVSMTLTYDHRIIDGAAAGQFMKTLSDFMEQPFKILA
jgi:pyruvate/2-oxoglutarate dehydrogenase complex dihydrolipoamide acyltransferase (E2) component